MLDLFSQPEIVLPAHNQHGNDEQFQENREHFKSQTEVVLEHLLKGEAVSSLTMFHKHQIMDCRARIFALKKSGYKIGERKVIGGKGSKEWYLEITTP